MADTKSFNISVKNLWKRFGQQEVLKGLSLEIPHASTMVILGRSGVGKSVLLRQIMGLDLPDQGSISIGTTCITDLKEDAKRKALLNIGMLFQSSALFDSMTIGENVAFYLHQNESNSLTPAQIEQKVQEALAQVGLEGYHNKMPSQLSGGQKRRAALARLIIYRPKVLLFDEPTTGLDPITASNINQLITKTVHSLNATAIVVTHDLNSAIEVGDYFALHHDGQIAFVDKKIPFLQKGDTLVRSYLEHAIVPPEFQNIIQKR